jgi:hypothetical protein
MKKSISIAALAISASSSFAIVFDPTDSAPQWITKTYCLAVHTHDDGSTTAGDCDKSELNARFDRPLLQNGCAAGQIALTTEKWAEDEGFPINIHSCMPPNIAQL